MIRRTTTVAAFVVLLAGGLVSAQDAPRKTVSGQEVEKRTKTVMKAYGWSNSVKDLEKRAQKEKKLIFWLQIVGKLDEGL